MCRTQPRTPSPQGRRETPAAARELNSPGGSASPRRHRSAVAARAGPAAPPGGSAEPGSPGRGHTHTFVDVQLQLLLRDALLDPLAEGRVAGGAHAAVPVVDEAAALAVKGGGGRPIPAVLLGAEPIHRPPARPSPRARSRQRGDQPGDEPPVLPRPRGDPAAPAGAPHYGRRGDPPPPPPPSAARGVGPGRAPQAPPPAGSRDRAALAHTKPPPRPRKSRPPVRKCDSDWAARMEGRGAPRRSERRLARGAACPPPAPGPRSRKVAVRGARRERRLGPRGCPDPEGTRLLPALLSRCRAGTARRRREAFRPAGLRPFPAAETRTGHPQAAAGPRIPPAARSCTGTAPVTELNP